MHRGIHQGCPLSALLFILCVQCLALKIKGSEKVSGIQIGNVECRLSQYTDDSALILKDEVSIINSFALIDEFSAISGLKLNIWKCEGLWLGPLRPGPKQFNDISFEKEVIGIFIGHDQNDCLIRNWNTKLLKFESILLKWKSIKLILFDKVSITNTLAIPLIILNMSILLAPSSILKSFKKLIFNFLPGKEI